MEPTTRFAGIVAAKYVEAGGDMAADGTDLGELHADSEVAYELPDEDQTTGGETPYQGEFRDATIKSFDMAKYDPVRTLYKADTRIDVELELEEGETMRIDGVLPRCMPDTRAGASGGRNTWTLEVRHFRI